MLLQSARKVQSEEARGHLRDAHHRVMSIAAVQRHLAQSSLTNVPLRPYLTQLRDSLGASMIHDPERLAITVTVDDSVVVADASVSLALIVTELVINALKHAFPQQEKGTISVDYRSDGTSWRLSVTDNGAGMLKGGNMSNPGLGTGIVDALARQLRGRIGIADASPRTAFTLDHDEVDNNQIHEIAAA